MLLIVAIAWIYVVLMMSITEHSVVAGIMTFLLYCVLPLTIILYLMGSPQRKRRRNTEKNVQTGANAVPEIPDAEAAQQSDLSSKN